MGFDTSQASLVCYFVTHQLCHPLQKMPYVNKSIGSKALHSKPSFFMILMIPVTMQPDVPVCNDIATSGAAAMTMAATPEAAGQRAGTGGCHGRCT